MEIDGQPIIDLLQSMDVEWSATRRIVIEVDAPGSVTVREFLRNKEGKLYREGNEPASHEVHADVRWPKRSK